MPVRRIEDVMDDAVPGAAPVVRIESAVDNSQEYPIPPNSVNAFAVNVQQLMARVPGEELTSHLDPEDPDEVKEWCAEILEVVRDYTMVKDFLPLIVMGEHPFNVQMVNPQLRQQLDGLMSHFLQQINGYMALAERLLMQFNSALNPPTIHRIRRIIHEGNADVHEYETVCHDQDAVDQALDQICTYRFYHRKTTMMFLWHTLQCIDNFNRSKAFYEGQIPQPQPVNAIQMMNINHFAHH